MSRSRLILPLWGAALLMLLSPAAQAGLWPFKDNKNKQHVGTTVHGTGQRAVRPLGTQLHPAKAVAANNRKGPKTILAQKPH